MEALKQRIEAFAAGGEADPEAVHEVIGLLDSGAGQILPPPSAIHGPEQDHGTSSSRISKFYFSFFS